MQLSACEKKELKKVIKLSPNFSSQGKLGKFIDKFLVCEVLARKAIIYYKKQYNKKVNDTYTITELKATFRKLGVFNKYLNCIDKIFPGGEGERNHKSARQLRNGYFHSLSPNDKNEIENNSEIIF